MEHKEKIFKRNVENILTLGPMQKGMLVHYLKNPGSEEYCEQLSLNITGEINIDVFKQAWDFVIETNEMLRTVFRWEQMDKPLQIVLKKVALPIEIVNFSLENNEVEKQKLLQNLKENDRKKKYDLQTGPLMRIYLCKLEEDNYEMIISNHHIIYDGWSNGIILKEFFGSYNKLVHGQRITPEVKSKYQEYLKWLQKLDSGEQERYWKRYLQGFDSKTLIPVDMKKEKEEFKVHKYVCKLNSEIITKMGNLIRNYKITEGSFFYTVWGILLLKYNNVEDVMFGTTVSGRPAEIENIDKAVGLFINTIPLRVQIAGGEKAVDLLNKINIEAQERHQFDNTPLVDIISYSEVNVLEGLFDSLVVIENYPLVGITNVEALRINFYSANEQANFDLNLQITTFNEYEVTFNYNQNVFRSDTIKRMAGHFISIINEILVNPEIKIADISIISAAEKEQILFEFNETKVDYPQHKTIHQLFEEQVEKRSNQIAVAYLEQYLTYHELNEKANQLARVLRSKGVGRDQSVGIMVEPSLEMIIGVLAIIKTGGAYLPIDIDYPQNRIDFMLEDADVRVLLVNEKDINQIQFAGNILYLADENLYCGDSSNLENINSSNDLIYIIYTSGSTGEPKGVMIEHQNVNRLISHMNLRIVEENERILQTGSLAFDASTFEIWATLLKGATLYLTEKENIISSIKLTKLLDAFQITLLWLTSPLFNQLVEENPDSFLRVNKLIVGGDALSPKHINLAKKHNKLLTIINGYGPTESTTFTTCFEIKQEYLNNIPVGKPISNTRVYIVDRNFNLQPIGVAGELCIAGDGLARGYLNRPGLTEEKFVKCPFLKDERVYRTGDLCRWLPDGNIEFLGRIDHQVKIRGFRIELGEIENCLVWHHGVKEAKVINFTDNKGEKNLCAYLVTHGELEISKIREYLARRLPGYMIPSYFTIIDNMPLTTNGKIDLKALPDPTGRIEREIIAPGNAIEEQLLQIWQETLGTEVIGVNDNFFEIGGHSLKATRLVANISKTMNIEVTLKEIFENPTIAKLAEIIDVKDKSIYSTIEPVEEQEYYPVSSAQKRLIVLNQFDTTSLSYNMPYIQRAEGKLDYQKIEKAVNHLIKRHEALRTSFEVIDGETVQRIHQEIEFKISYLEAEEDELENLVLQFIEPFDLSEAPLFRIKIIKYGDKHLLMFDMHHIISDGVSMNLFSTELIKLYNGLELPELKIQYKDFAVWQNQLLKSEKIKKQEDYWLKTYSDEIPILNLSTDYPRPSVMSFKGDHIEFRVTKESTDRLNDLARQNNATLFMVLLSAYDILMAKYSNQDDIIVGSPIAGRPHADLENIIGMFVNTLALRNKPKGSKTFIEFLSEVRENALKAYENQNYQFEMLVDHLNLPRDLSRNPLFNTAFSLQNMSFSTFELPDLKLLPYHYDFKIAKFDVQLVASETANGIEFSLEYNTNLFKDETAERIAKHYVKILEEIIKYPDNKLSEIVMISVEEQQKFLIDFNQAQSDYPKNSTINQLFEEQAKSRPDKIAVVYGDQKLTYQELNEKSNQLARVLRDCGVENDQIVALMAERSLEIVIGIMAILKSGGAYLPIDPEYPTERIEFMLKDSNTTICLTQSHLLGKVTSIDKVINLNDQNIFTGNKTNLENVNGPKDLVYIIYTSGSTGNPKGVMIEHRGLVNYAIWAKKVYMQGEQCDFPLYSSLSFDLTVTSIYLPLISGSRIVIYGTGDKELLITQIIQDDQVQIVKLTPAHLKIIQNSDVYSTQIKRFIVGGEELKRELAKEIYHKFGGKVEIYNEYGPTETVVGCMIHRYDEEKDTGVSVPIGVPADNVQIYLLDQYRHPVALGIPGEIYIAGDGVARGYLNRAELTADKFVENSFIPETRMYRTGDLARLLPNGRVEFLGRIDNQVKIRGYRIELGEIENQLLSLALVKEAIVVDSEDLNGDKSLCAYLVVEEGFEIQALRKELTTKLPQYMIPTYFIQLDKMPLTPNGKIDRNALPNPTSISTTKHITPRNTVEEKLLEIWIKVLDVQNVGITDNFFEMGGHSLKAARLRAYISKEMNVELSLMEIFERPTIVDLAEIVAANDKSIYSGIEPVGEQGYYPVSSAQKRLYIVNQLDENSLNYNMPYIVEIGEELDYQKLENVIKQLIKRHEALRTSFDIIDGEVVQKIHQDIDFKINYREAREKELSDQVQQFIRPFDLSKAPLLRVEFVKHENGSLLMMDMYHIVSDGVSQDIFFSELIKLYDELELPELRIQYKDFAVWQNQFLQSEQIKKQEQYWLEEFADEIPILSLPTDYQRPSIMKYEGDQINFRINPDATKKLHDIAHQNNATLFMVLLSVYNILLEKYSGQEDIIVGSPIAGRPHADLENIMGIFVNMLALRNYPLGNETYTNFLAKVRENALEAYDNQDYQFEMLVEKLGLDRDVSRNPLFDTVFTLQNMNFSTRQLSLMQLVPQKYDYKITKFDLQLTVTETDYDLACTLQYSTRLFKADTIQRMATHFTNILVEIVKNPEITLNEIKMISLEEMRDLIINFNQTEASYPAEKTIHQLLDDQVIKNSERVAVSFGNSELTYCDLNRKANQVARALREKGVQREQIIGIMCERSLEMVIGILGILKAGGAYLPIDPAYPEDRIEYLFEDSKMALLLMQKFLSNKVEFTNERIFLDDQQLYTGADSNLNNINHPGDLAYIIYTSGSTGKPKGVMIEHRNVVRLLFNDKFQFDFTENDVWTVFHSFSFDFSVWEMYGALLYGGKLIVIPKLIAQNPQEYLQILRREKVTILNQTPTAFYNLSDEEMKQPTKELYIRYVIFGGEALKPMMLKAWTEKYPETRMINMYGITETTVHVTYKAISSQEIETNVSNIGKPIPTLTTYVMNNQMKLVPIGVPGELCVGGAGVGRGYLNRPDLTAEKFISNPYRPEEKIYRSGDLVKLLSNGDLEYLGRIDRQVKIRGFRIELGEIERQLLKHDLITNAVVVDNVDQHGRKYLSAYYVAKEELVVGELWDYLSQKLPEYMIPAYFIRLDQIPLTSNGKINRKALPEIDSSINTGVEYVAPQNESEKVLAQIWQDVLGIERVGILDNFFEIGGDSIKAIQILARASQHKINIKVKDVFQYKTIAAILQNVDCIKEKKNISQEEVSGEIPLTPIQHWFFERKLNYPHYYNQAIFFKLAADADLERLENVFKKVIEHHDALRMIYKFVDDQIIQINRKVADVEFKLEIVDLSNESYEVQKEKVIEICEKMQDRLVLASDLLIKACIFNLGDQGVRLFIPIHHLVIDGVSWRIILEDIQTLYNSNLTEQLPLKTTSYKEWSLKLNEYANNKIVNTKYWDSINLAKIRSLSNLEERDNYCSDEQSLVVELDKVQTEQLLTKVSWPYNTGTDEILLAALTLAIAETMGLKEVLINLEGHGREDIMEDVDISRTVGWFTSIYPVYFEIQENISKTIIDIKESLKRVPNKGLPFAIGRYLHQNENLQKINPEISYNYLGQLDNVLQNDQESILARATENCGRQTHLRNQNSSLLDVVGMIINGKLQISFTYNPNYLNNDLMKKLQHLYLQKLNEIIDHCVSTTERIFTASDFGMEDVLDEADFAMIITKMDPTREKLYSLTPMQEGLLFHNILNNEGSSYYIQLCFYIEGKIEIDYLKMAWQEMINRHEIYKTRYIWDKTKTPVQIISETHPAEIYEYDITYLDPSEQAAYLEDFKANDLRRKFDFAKGKLNRLSLVKMESHKYYICWTLHHIISDGWSNSVAISDLFTIYSCLIGNQPLPAKPVGQFSQYLDWLKNQDKEQGLRFWRKYMKDFVEPTFLPANREVKDRKMISEGSLEEVIFDQDQTKVIQDFCRTNSITMNAFFQTAWGILLQKYNNSRQGWFGMTVSGRPHDLKNVEEIVGIFINTLPVLVNADEHTSIINLLKKINKELIEIREYEYLPLAEIQKMSGYAGNLIDSMIAFENYPMSETIDKLNLEFKVTIDSSFEMTNYDLTIVIAGKEMVTLQMRYNKELFTSLDMARIRGHLVKLFNTMLHESNKSIDEICLLTESETLQLVYEFNNTKTDYPRMKTIHQLFEEQAMKEPDQVAIVYGEQQLTYRELNEQSNQLARVLSDHGVERGQIVALMAERSLEMVSGILAVLKAGGAYLPIDPAYPAERIEFMLKDSNATICLTQNHLLGKVSSVDKVIDLNDQNIFNGDNKNPDNVNSPEDLVYIIYTSGSTGNPKGVMIEHRGLVNYAIWAKKVYLQGEQCDFPLYSSLSFDLTVTSIYLPLISGSKIVIYGTEDRESLITKIVKDDQVQIVKLTPAHLQIIQNMDVCRTQIKRFIVGGEDLKRELAKAIYHKFGGKVEIYNEYGPTETVVGCMLYRYDDEKDTGVSVPIGVPADNVQIYLLDQQRQPVAWGIPGEIYISGEGVARGYLNRMELTRDKFVENPFIPGTRMYKTGDLARFLPNGNMVFLGRIDNQVKIRGYRIELGEIENQLLNLATIREVLVADSEDHNGDKYLCAYLVAEEKLEMPVLKKDLAAQLPEYMIPTYFIQLEKMPLTLNGKIDRKALPSPNELDNKECSAPRNAFEEKLLDIWQQVLDRRDIGITDNFFEMGGHSLKATRLRVQISKEMGTELSLKEIFERPTIVGLAEIINAKEESIYSSIESVEEQDYYPTSSAQKRLFILDQLDANSTAYNMPIAIIIEDAVEKLEDIIKAMIKRHEIFRTSFEIIDGTVMQRVHSEVDFKIDFARADEDQLEKSIAEFIKPFDLSKAPLLRGTVIESGDKHLLLMDMHHIISDGISMEVFYSEVVRLLNGEELECLRIQYKDFAIWQNELLQSDLLENQENYWLGLFADEVPVLDLPTDFPRSSKMSLKGETLRFSTGRESKERLEKLATEQGVTLNMLMLSIYNILLSKYTAQEDIVIGTPVAGRNHADLEKIIGFFVNTLVMRNYPQAQKTFEEFLNEVKINSLAAYENQDYQFEMLIEKLNLKRDLGRNPLFDTLFDFHTASQGKFYDSKFKPYNFDLNSVKFDLSLECLHIDDDLLITIEYTTDLYKKETIERMANHLTQIINEVINHPQIQIFDIEMVTSKEKEQLIYGLNNYQNPIPTNTTVCQLIEKQAELHPERVALTFNEQRITYQELNERSNQLARVLCQRGITQDRLVGILLDRSPLMVVSILATWKAGGAYIPIDSTYPEQRIKGILLDSNATLLLTTSEYLNFACEELSGVIIELDTWKTKILNESMANLDTPLAVNSLAYVIYTSGSTGKPKGAMVEHLGMLNHMQAKINDLALDERSIVVQNASHCFDISVWQFFVAMVVGGKTIIYPNELTMNPEKLIDRVIQDEVTILEVVPSFLSVMLDILENKFRNFNTLNYLLVTGEMVKPNLVKRWFKLYPTVQMVNAYGPTEASDDITHHIMTEAPNTESISIGRPVDNFHIYIVDNNMKLCPIGVKGEICVSGIGVGRGYLNDLNRTKAVFMEDPFVHEKGVRLYKTGDLGRWLEDGTIEFFGRKDYQVKIRGFRIELGEIEAKLVEHTQVKEAIVLNKEDRAGNQYLCAYLVKENISISDIKTYLSESLPNYMVPAFFVELEQMPLNANGKLDRKALPEISTDLFTDTKYVAPANAIEKEMAEIWSEILGIGQISVLANFFDLGGHSLNTMQLVAKVNQRFNAILPLQEVFKTPTIKELAAYITKADKIDYETIQPVEEREYYPASYAQKRFYLLRQLLKNGTEYNMPQARMIEGDLDPKRLEKAINALVERHEVLRTSFELVDGMLVQRVHKTVEIKIEFVEAKEDEIQTICKEFIRPFDLSQVPLFRVGNVKCGAKSFLLIDMYHIISDGISSDILLEEFFRLYTGNELPKLRIQYRDFAIWQNEYFRTPRFQKQREYWLDRFAGEIPLLDILPDHQRDFGKDSEGKSQGIIFTEEVTAKVNELIANKGVTLYMFLLSVCNILLWKYSGQNDIIIGTPISGRSQADLEKMIGVFVNTLPMRNYPHGNKEFNQFLDEVKENTLSAYENQDYPFDLLVEELKIKRAADRNPLFDVILILQNWQSKSLEQQKLVGLQLSPVDFGDTTARFDLRFAVSEGTNKLHIEVEYKANLFAEETIASLLQNLLRIVETVVSNTDVRLGEIKLESNLQHLEMVSVGDIDFGF